MKSFILLRAMFFLSLFGLLVTIQAVAAPNESMSESLTCYVHVRLPNGQTRSNTFIGKQDLGRRFLLASGPIALMDDHPLELYAFFDGQLGYAEISHEQTDSIFYTHTEKLVNGNFNLFVRVGQNPKFNEVNVRCEVVQ